ncbi:MAG: helix-turn-helix transcriptional regulator [Luteolibacter sp.]
MPTKPPKDLKLILKDHAQRVAATRRPLIRIYEIHSAILEDRFPNCSQIAKRLGVERKTIQRDITFMRDELHLPIVYHESMHGYYYAEDVAELPSFQTSAEELAGLFLTRQVLESIRGTTLAEILANSFSKLTRGMIGQVDLSWKDLDQAFSRKSLQPNPRDIKQFGKIAQAILNRQVIGFHYKKLKSIKHQPRKVNPLHLGEVDGGWYLIAHDHDRDALRTFALPRITRLVVKRSRFPRPDEFDGHAYLKKSFGIWNVAGDKKQHLVRVELRNYAAQLAHERRWHPTQELVPLNKSGSRVELRFEVGRLEEVMRWVLSFGSHARVIAPVQLSRMVRKEVRAMMQD